MILCHRCRHFVGVDVEGEVVCEKLGRTKPMVLCKHFELRSEPRSES